VQCILHELNLLTLEAIYHLCSIRQKGTRYCGLSLLEHQSSPRHKCFLFMLCSVPETHLQYCAVHTVYTDLGGYIHGTTCEAPGRKDIPWSQWKRSSAPFVPSYFVPAFTSTPKMWVHRSLLLREAYWHW